MIIIEIEEKTYKKDSNILNALSYADEHLISSFDFSDDEFFVEDATKNNFWNEDVPIRFFNAYSSNNNKNDKLILSCLYDFALSDPKELRYWFKDIPYGTKKTILLTSWEENENDGTAELVFEGFE